MDGSATPIRVESYRKRWLLAVGISSYGDGQDLKNAAVDAAAVFLRLTQDFGFSGRLLAPPEDIAALSTQASEGGLARVVASGDGSRGSIEDTFDAFAHNMQPDDLVVVFFAGHATKDGAGYIWPRGAQFEAPSTLLMFEELFDHLDRLPCLHRVLILDCCFAGVVTKTGRAPTLDIPQDEASRPILLAPQTAVFAATSSWETTPDAYILPDASGGVLSRHSAFTAAFLDIMDTAAPGEALFPESIAAGLIARMATSVCVPHPNRPSLTPHSALFGEGRLAFVRDGLAINGPEAVAAAGAGPPYVAARFSPSGGRPPYAWKLKGEVAGVWQEGGVLWIDPAEFDAELQSIVVEVGDAAGLTAQCDVQIEPAGDAAGELALANPTLPACLSGQDYRAALELVGGRGASRIQAHGLPKGLRLSTSPLEISGQVALTPGDRARRTVRLDVEDETGRQWSRRYSLSLVDADAYCEVPALTVALGYTDTEARRAALAEIGGVDRSKLQPSSIVASPAFFIKRTPVTNAEWRRFIDTTGRDAAPPYWSKQDFDPTAFANRPVVDVTLDDVHAYCAWRDTRLPSAAEWEVAARGSDGRLFPWGDKAESDYCASINLYRLPDNVSIPVEDAWRFLTPVEQFPYAASPFGLLDMCGNAWERVRARAPEGSGVWRQTFRGGGLFSTPREWMTFEPSSSGERLQAGPDGTLQPNSERLAGPIGFRDVIELERARHAQGYVVVPGGRFSTPSGEAVSQGASIELARYAVSNAEFFEFTQATGAPRPPNWKSGAVPFADADEHLPIVGVPFQAAQAFVDWKTQTTGRQHFVMTRQIFHLAAHGGARRGAAIRRFPWGETFNPSLCNSVESGWGGVRTVDDLPEGRAASGAVNLIGNVWEWVGPNLIAGGGWRDTCADPAAWVRKRDGAGLDIGFRYFRRASPARRPS